MGRTIPMEEITSIHPTFSLALLIAWMAALVATISGLCGIWSKKSSKSSSIDDSKTKTQHVDVTNSPSRPSPQPQSTQVVDTTTNNNNNDDQFSKPLPPPPSAARIELGEGTTIKPKIDKSSSLQNYISKSTSRRKLTSSLSMRMSMKIKDKASGFKDKASEIKDLTSDIKDIGKKDQDSLWTKRIIRGEKCRLPNDDDDDDEFIVFDDQGNRVVSELETKLPLPHSMSRSCSSIDHRRILSHASEGHNIIKEKEKGKETVLEDHS